MALNSWKYGIFDCARQSLALNACGFFPLFVPFIVTNIASRARRYVFGLGFCGMLMLTCFCGYVNYGTSIAMDYVSDDTVSTILGLVGALCAGVLFAIFYIVRVRLREKLLIAGDSFYDCLLSFFCPCCSMVQMAGEVELQHVHILEPPDEYEVAKL